MITIEASELEAIPRLDLQLQGMGHETTVVPHLPVGDYLWVQRDTLCLAERKKVPGDLISSFEDGRLQRFVEEAPPDSFRCLLLHLPDSLRKIQGGLGYARWDWPRLDALLMSVQREGVYLAWAIDDVCGVAERLHGLVEWTGREQHTALHRPIPPQVTSGYDPRYRRQVAALMCTPGIGEELAQRVLSGDLAGIGPVRVQAVKDFWGPVLEAVNLVIGGQDGKQGA